MPSARFTATDLLRSACLAVDGTGWEPALIGLLDGVAADRTVALARRGESWWLGEADRLDDATSQGRLDGTARTVGSACRDPQLWSQTPDAGTFLSWLCEDAGAVTLTGLRVSAASAPITSPLATVPRGSTHVTGDFNGDGLTDVVVREGDVVSVLLQCSTDMVGTTPGC